MSKRPASLRDLTAAAEAFESLTEQAFTADPAKLSGLLGEAKTAADKIEPQLNGEIAGELKARIREADSAIAERKPADTALAAVEGFRLVASAMPSTLKTPPQVSLLDYSGFRIQADLRAQPVRWNDAQDAFAFANDQWKAVSTTVADKGLAYRFQSALDRLGGALEARNHSRAAQTVATELDLVDDLETYFVKAT